MKNNESFVIGVDYGTASVRSILVNTNNGKIIAESSFDYPRWKIGLYCNPSKNQFRQHPLDHIEGLEFTINNIVNKVSANIIQNIKAISIDTTGSTPVAVDKKGIPLALLDEFSENPNAMFFLWKDHTAMKEADEINAHAKKFKVDYLQFSGGTYSSEWFWAKFLYALRIDKDLRKVCVSWVEHCDWMPFLLTGGKNYKEIKRGVCAAGHKAIWAAEHGGLPPKDFFSELDPLLNEFEYPFFSEVLTADKVAGNLCEIWADKLGLSQDVKVGIGALDAHFGAVGGEIEPYFLSKVMGTSTCDMLVIPNDEIGKLVLSGISGQVNGSIIPGMIGFEAGQSAFGDVYAWFKKLISKTIIDYIIQSKIEDSTKQILIHNIENNILKDLGERAKLIPLDKNSEIAIDWFNGRRTPYVNSYVKGGLFNLNLGSDAARMFHSLVEATCFGAKKIVEHFKEIEVPIKGIIAMGGVAKKSDFVMQMMSDVLGMTIKVPKVEQPCAFGAAIFATVIAGIYPNIKTATDILGQGFDKVYKPDVKKMRLYSERYEKYCEMCSFLEKY